MSVSSAYIPISPQMKNKSHPSLIFEIIVEKDL